MDSLLKKKIIAYYTKYYRDACSLPDYEKRVAWRLTEEQRESDKLHRLEKIFKLAFSRRRHLIVGAGTGGEAVALNREFHADVFGLEPNSEGVEIIHDKCKAEGIDPRRFINAYAEQIPFADNEFDFVHCVTVLEHVADIKLSLSEMIRVTKPGGHIYINTPNYSFPYEGHYKINFPTFLPRFFGQLYLILLGKNFQFLRTINYITESSLDSILARLDGITWLRFYEPVKPYRGRWRGRLLNYLIFSRGIYPNQEILIMKG
jgi:ubiquinone/menaquinone biosynthesis C-methylase UbiE